MKTVKIKKGDTVRIMKQPTTYNAHIRQVIGAYAEVLEVWEDGALIETIAGPGGTAGEPLDVKGFGNIDLDCLEWVDTTKTRLVL